MKATHIVNNQAVSLCGQEYILYNISSLSVLVTEIIYHI